MPRGSLALRDDSDGRENVFIVAQYNTQNKVCLHYHWKNGELPGCLFPPELEKTYDRSLRAFIEYYKDRI
ncbi:MAG: hypothetical protein ACTSRV_11300 [Candidatus Freyarchaeota archaeon]